MEDRNLLLALAQVEADECSGCGNSLTESTDPATQHQWTVTRRTCEACRVLEAEVENDNEPGAGKKRGLKYAVRRIIQQVTGG